MAIISGTAMATHFEIFHAHS